MSKDLSDSNFVPSASSEKSEVVLQVDAQEPLPEDKSEVLVQTLDQASLNAENSEMLPQATPQEPLPAKKSEVQLQASIKDSLLAKSSSEPSWRTSINFSSFRFWFKLLWIVLHYFDIVSDYLTLRTFWEEGYKYYFYPLLVCLVIAWILGVAVLWSRLEFSTITKILICVLQLDFVLLNLDHPRVESPAENLKVRKRATLYFQTVPSVFITVHSIFVEQVTSLTPQLSLIFTIWDFAFSNAAVDMDISTFDDVKVVLSKTVRDGLQNSLIWLTWGFLATYTRPAGAWIYFPVANTIFAITACMFRSADRHRCDNCGNLIFGFTEVMKYNGKYVDDDNEQEDDDFDLKEINVWAQAIVMWAIIGGAYHEEFGNSLEELTWTIYFYSIIGCACILIIGRFILFLLYR